jgi:hypothetical protein
MSNDRRFPPLTRQDIVTLAAIAAGTTDAEADKWFPPDTDPGYPQFLRFIELVRRFDD